MTAPIRPLFAQLTDFGSKEPAEYSLREAIEWYKRCVKGARDSGVPTALESNLLNEQWVVLVKAIAERQGVPTGSLSYFLAELAKTEMHLLEIAQEEAEAAGVST